METQFIIDRLDSMEKSQNERFDDLDAKVQQHFDLCQRICISRIEVVNNKAQVADEKAEKAHQRLDRQKSSIEELCAHKHKNIGFQSATKWTFAALGLIISLLSLYLGWLRLRN